MRSRREGERNKVHDVPVSVSQGAHDARVECGESQIHDAIPAGPQTAPSSEFGGAEG